MTTTNNNQWRTDFQVALSSIQPTHMATMNYAKPLSGNRDARFRTVVAHICTIGTRACCKLCLEGSSPSTMREMTSNLLGSWRLDRCWEKITYTF